MDYEVERRKFDADCLALIGNTISDRSMVRRLEYMVLPRNEMIQRGMNIVSVRWVLHSRRKSVIWAAYR